LFIILIIYCDNSIKFIIFRKSLTKEEVNELLEEGRFYLACLLMNNEQNEEAIEAFKKLHSPYASFYQAMVSKNVFFKIWLSIDYMFRFLKKW